MGFVLLIAQYLLDRDVAYDLAAHAQLSDHVVS